VSDVGFYNLAWRLCNLPATGIGYIVGRAMFPAYATLRTDRAAFRDAFMTNVRRVALFSLPVGLGIALAADSIVVGLFGARWEPAVGPLRVLAVYGIVRSFAGTTGAVLQAAGKPYLLIWLNVWHLGVLCATLFTLTPAFGLEGAATAMTITGVASLVPSFRLALRTLELSLQDLLVGLWRPVLCSVPVAAALVAAERSMPGVAPALRLAALVLIGATVSAAAIMTLGRSEMRAITAAFRSS
jgi:O-antigen/teichoic acid export membrane protein